MKYILTTLFLCFAFTGMTQVDVSGNRIIGKSLYLRDRWVDTIANDTASWDGKVRTLPTADAVLKQIKANAGISSVKNGIKKSNDSLSLGGNLTDSITHFFLPVTAKTDQNVIAKAPVFVLSNRSLESDLTLSDWRYWRERGANALLWGQRLLNEVDNDTAAQQYNGMINLFNRITQDHNSNRFNYLNGGKATNMQYSGVYGINQLYPTASTLIQPGWFGRDGAVFAGAFGFGKDSAYNILIATTPSMPVPLSMYKGDIDFNRGVPSGKSRQMSGPISVYTAGWRSYQSAMGAANTSNPSRIGDVAMFHALGSVSPDPFAGQGLTKSDILARSAVDTATAVKIEPQYLPTNEVVNGFAILQKGIQDFNHFAGKVRIGGSMPNRPAVDTMQERFQVYGDALFRGTNNVRFQGNALGSFPGMYWLLAPDSAGAQANIDFGSSASRDSRGMIIGVGTSGTATAGYPASTGAGWWLDIRTGTGGVNVRRFWRNGNTVFGSNAALYQDSAKVFVTGTIGATGLARAATPAIGDNSRNLATTEWVNLQGYQLKPKRAVVQTDFTLANVTTAQTAFPSAIDQIAVEANSTYRFEFSYILTNGTASHSTGVGFNIGSATLNWINYSVTGFSGTVNTAGAVQTSSWWNVPTPSSGMVATSTDAGTLIRGVGYISVNTAGDITPQIIFSDAPGGTNLMKQGSYITFQKVGDGTFSNDGFK